MKLVATIALLSLTSCATLTPADPARLLADAMQRRPIVLLGEVHDNEAQHAMRAEALRLLLERGARPAIAFEQFDRERQGDLDRARVDALPSGADRIDYLVAQAKGAPNWNWKLYRPYLELALKHDLPIIAANLSRADAMRVAQGGFNAVFDAQASERHGFDRLPIGFLQLHERAVDEGHCKLMPAAMLPQLARAQIARDATLAQAIRPYAARGVVLLTGNGHARNDIGVPQFLSELERARTVTIGLIEPSARAESDGRYDVVFVTPVQPRDDPCGRLHVPR